MRRRIGRIGSKRGSNWRSCTSGFSWAGVSCVISLGIGNCLWLVLYKRTESLSYPPLPSPWEGVFVAASFSCVMCFFFFFAFAFGQS